MLWGTYRRLLGQIEGLTVVNLKPTDCCVRAAADSIEEAKSKGLDTIVNTCISCNAWLLKVSKGSGVKLKLLPEVLLDAVRGRA
ncbi:MAG: hypothetical protein HYX94_08685 [Chloroflexi bacterium]|nr:hypothetical protein [Chloroflexota bacterium]